MNRPVFVCEICFKPLGTVDLDRIATPMKPDMFLSLDRTRGIPAPFLPVLDFSLFRCRQCKARPFKTPDHITILDKKGFRKPLNVNKINIEQKIREQNQAKIEDLYRHQCRKCGKVYQHQSSLSRHEKACNG